MSANTNMRSKSIRPAPSEIQHKNMSFLITDRPTDSTMQAYVEELKKHEVHDVVRVCEPTYKTDELKNGGITVTDLVFDDGTFPPNEVVEEWLQLLRECHRKEPGRTVAVHCVAGLGRAPVLVAIALIELGMRYEDAVELIRELVSSITCGTVSVKLQRTVPFSSLFWAEIPLYSMTSLN
ncbi:UNVERIFIED_CONTAM: hypothetical protein GTU68_045170 [Idotea baltica]|nr:hypothetical protein [Idotea baltica]